MFLDFSLKLFSEPKTAFEEQVLNFVDEWFSESEKIKVQTSGSTGIPKILEVEKHKMRISANMTCDFLGLKSGDTALLCLPVEYISGKMMLVRAMERKLKIIVKTPSLMPLEDGCQSVDFCAMTPLQVERSLDKIHGINKLIIGGASVSEQLKGRLREQLLPVGNYPLIYETYGMSETLSHIALKQIVPKNEDYFRCLGGIEIDKDNRGCLVVDAPKFSDEKLITNDLVEIIDNCSFRFLGRLDNVINSGGVKIFPEVLEALVKKIIPNEVVFVGFPDEALGQKLVLVVEGEENEEMLHGLLLVDYPLSFHRPKEILFVGKIPRTPNGKVSRASLMEYLSANKV